MVIGLTVLIVRPFRHVVFPPRANTVWPLLALDVIRWGSLPVSSLFAGNQNEFATTLGTIFSFLAVAVPTIFAVVAILLAGKPSPYGSKV